MLTLFLAEFYGGSLFLAHGIPFFPHEGHNVAHAPGRVLALDICLATLDVQDEARNLPWLLRHEVGHLEERLLHFNGLIWHGQMFKLKWRLSKVKSHF